MLNQHKTPSFTSTGQPPRSPHIPTGATDTLSPQLEHGRGRSQQTANGVSPATATGASRPCLGSTGPTMGVKPQALLYPAPN